MVTYKQATEMIKKMEAQKKEEARKEAKKFADGKLSTAIEEAAKGCESSVKVLLYAFLPDEKKELGAILRENGYQQFAIITENGNEYIVIHF